MSHKHGMCCCSRASEPTWVKLQMRGMQPIPETTRWSPR